MKKKNKKSIGGWIRTAFVIAISVGIVAASGLYWLSRHNANTTQMDVYVTAPNPTDFTDDMSTVLSNNFPDINNNRDLSRPRALRISYDAVSGPSNPAFRYDSSNASIAQNVKISPAIRGTWKMPNPNEITFTSEQDWPAGTKFTVKINNKLFTRDVRPNRSTVSFKTEPIVATTDIFNTYATPGEKNSVTGVAIISFNYPIQTRDFADKVSMKLDGRHIDFTVKFDHYMRTAMIQTAPIKITDEPQTLRFKLNRISDADEKSRTEKITAKTIINSAEDFFKIADVSTITADDRFGAPQQLLLLNTTAAAKENTNWSKYINAYLLPKKKPSEPDEDVHTWARDEITPEIIGKSEKLGLKHVDFVNPAGTYQYAFSYDVSDDVARYIYVDIAPDMQSENGFTMKNGMNTVMPVAFPERSVKIVGRGALLSLAGDKKLGLVARGGVDTAHVDIYKIESREINHLITQTYNLFSNLEFRAPWVFDAYDMSVVFQKKIPFANTARDHVNYTSINLGEYLDRTYNDQTGIFVIKAGATQNDAEYGDARLILLTDLGIIRKINLDRSSVVFVSYLSSGKPAKDIDITVLGRNGQPIWSGVTNSDGVVDIPHFSHDEYRNEKEPVAIVARHDNDVSFIPYNAEGEQTTEFSKFDIGGTYASNTTPLRSFVFSDRGIYRPGETVTIGAIVENQNFSSVAEIPIKIEITDPRGRTVTEKKISLNSDGMFDIAQQLPTDATIGRYDVNIYSLNNRGRIQDSIGNSHFTVQEFVPDTMKINARIDDTKTAGWISPENIMATVFLNNLYGTPATDRRISVHATLRPFDFTFDEYRGYKFTGNFTSDGVISRGLARTGQTFSIDLPDTRTDENGVAKIDVNFNREIPTGTYMLNLEIRGFEAGDGKSVQTAIASRVSNLGYLVGFHADSDLSYVARNSEHKIKLIALDNNAKATNAENLNVKLVKRENLTTLIKDYSNNYKYKTVARDTVVSVTQLTIPKSGTEIELNTKNGGTYYIQITDSKDNILANIEYFVASDEDAELGGDANAELQIKLDRHEYKPGETINIGIVAPYTGTGLITIERDKVYAHAWFNATTTASTQKITLPDNFEGTGYVNVSFVRNINSRDVFTSPYTYGVAPFSTNIDKHKIKVELNTEPIIHDNKLDIEYSTNKNSDLMIFAVNTGILQVAGYELPNPIKHFFQKAALQVETTQILSLLLPEYNILREVAKTGGSDDALADFGNEKSALVNPFARKNLPSIAFYSGILKTTANEKKNISFEIPEYFNGSISVYAVAASNGAIGSAHTSTTVQSPVIISVSAPSFVAPNDKFTVNTIISNLTPESGENATARTDAVSANKLLTIANNTNTMVVPENTEKLWAFDVTANGTLGTSDINVSTTLFDDKNTAIASRRASSSLSIRPATTFTTKIKTGMLKDTNTTLRHFENDMYDEKFARTIYISRSPSVLVRPLFMYLKNYDYTCTEQMVSKTLPYVLMPENKLLGTEYKDSAEKIAKTIQTLGNRQNNDGSFTLWANGSDYIESLKSDTTPYVTAYVMNFLTLARQGGFTVPQSMFARGIDFLREYAAQNTTTKTDAFAKAFTIYVLSLNDYVTTSYIDSLEEYLNENIKDWETGPIGAYIAASYKMLKQTDKAFNLISKYETNKKPNKKIDNIFDNIVANDAVYTFIMRRYFDTAKNDLEQSIAEYINAGNYDSFVAAAIVMSESGASENLTLDDIDSISILADGKQIKPQFESGTIYANLPRDLTKLNIGCKNCKEPLFYTMLQQGFPKSVSPTSHGFDVTRTYYGADGNEIHSGKIGDIVDVKISVRARGDTDYVENAVITDLLPGGFAPITDSLAGDMDFSEIREDRVLIYANIGRTPLVFSYRAQLSVAGEFTVPPITAAAMYNSAIRAVGDGDKFIISNEAN